MVHFFGACVTRHGYLSGDTDQGQGESFGKLRGVSCVDSISGSPYVKTRALLSSGMIVR